MQARYSLKTGRKAPKGYDAWFAWCKERGLLVDSYDQVYQVLLFPRVCRAWP